MPEISESKPVDLEAVARRGGTLRRIAARVPTYLADLKENPAWLLMFVLARTMPVRRAHWRTAKPVPKGDGAPSMFGSMKAEEIADELRRSGIFAGLVLPDSIRQQLASFGAETACFGNFDRKLEFDPLDHGAAERNLGRTIVSGHHFERILQCEAAMSVQRDPLLLDIARHYLGGEARLITTRMWWSFPTQSVSEVDLNRASFRLHFDLDDWRMLKFFFYLSDVDENSGAHVYIRGSHKRRRLKHQFTLMVGHPVEEVVGYYGEESVTTLTGKAGYGFVEDPFGFHMGTLPKKSPRLMMEIGFGISRPSKRRYHGEPVVR